MKGIFMIRFLLVALFVGVFLVLSIPLMLAELIIGKFNPSLKDRTSLAIVQWAFRCVMFISGAKVDYIGRENIPTDIPVLYVGNHRSDYDIPLTYTQVPNPTGYISKMVISKFKLLSVWMRNLHCVFINRDNVKESLKAILTSIDMIKNGISVCIFPEGTRNKTEADLLPFHEGSFKIASKAGCPIVPITINNSEALFEKQYPRMKKAHVIVEYGKPIYINELPKETQKSLSAYVQNIIRETYTKNKELI
jgi:1-acyl-sn-glycerol-3-phosphate acyltransferase